MRDTEDWVWGATVNRERLVRLCARLTGDFECADDLAQQTLLEAWLHEDGLRDPSRREQWLNGIARNVCRRWARSRSRVREVEYLRPENAPADSDVEVELERDELAVLLDKALDLLRPEERALLIAHYIEGRSKKELADQLGLHAGTLAVRLHRGRLALRRVISKELRDDALSYGLPAEVDDGFVQSSLWCFLCGESRMRGRIDRETGELALKCDKCCSDENAFVEKGYLGGNLERIRSAHRRAMSFYQGYGWPALREGRATCIGCGSSVGVRYEEPFRVKEDFPALQPGEHGAFIKCPDCGYVSNMPLRFLAFGLPQVQEFWQRHPRLRLRPETTQVVSGSAMFVVGAESIVSPDAIEVLCSPDDYALVDVRTMPAAPPLHAPTRAPETSVAAIL